MKRKHFIRVARKVVGIPCREEDHECYGEGYTTIYVNGRLIYCEILKCRHCGTVFRRKA